MQSSSDYCLFFTISSLINLETINNKAWKRPHSHWIVDASENDSSMIGFETWMEGLLLGKKPSLVAVSNMSFSS